MELFLRFMGMVYDALNMPIYIFGYPVSVWGIIMFTLIVGVIFDFVRHMFYDN